MKGPLAIKYTMEAVNRGIEVNLDEGSEIETELLLKCFLPKMKIGLRE